MRRNPPWRQVCLDVTGDLGRCIIVTTEGVLPIFCPEGVDVN